MWAVGLLVACGLAAAGCRTTEPQLLELDRIEQLQARFNADAGQPRVVLLLSPT